MATSFAETMAAAQLLADGLRDNLDKVAKRGMDQAFVAVMEETARKVHALNAEQEALKMDLKNKTTELEATLAELKGHVSESKKVIKLALDPANWKQFGVS